MPETFVAVTLNVYEVPFVRPVTVQVVVAVVHDDTFDRVNVRISRSFDEPAAESNQTFNV